MRRFYGVFFVFSFTFVYAAFSDEKVEDHAKNDNGKKKQLVEANTNAESLQPYKKYDLLLFYPSLAKELKLTQSQIGNILKLYDKEKSILEQRKTDFKALPAIDDPLEKKQRASRFVLSRKQLQREIEGEMLKVLTKEQSKRLNEIHIQLEGPIAFLRPEMQSQLNLVVAQTTRIEELLARADKMIDKTFSVPPKVRDIVKPDPENPSKAVVDPARKAELRAEWDKRHKERMIVRSDLMNAINNLLSKRQRQIFDKLKGEPFEGVADLKRHVGPPSIGSATVDVQSKVPQN